MKYKNEIERIEKALKVYEGFMESQGGVKDLAFIWGYMAATNKHLFELILDLLKKIK